MSAAEEKVNGLSDEDHHRQQQQPDTAVVAAEVPSKPQRQVPSACRPDRPNCKPLIIYLPDELFSDHADEWDDEDKSGESDEEKPPPPPPPPRQNGRQIVPPDDPVLDQLLKDIVHRFEPDQPDMLDRLIAMFNSGKCLGEEGEAQMRRLQSHKRRRERRRARMILQDPNWVPGRRQMRMADCFRRLGSILLHGDAKAASGGRNGLVRAASHTTQADVAKVVSPTSSDVDEGAVSLAASTSSSMTEPEKPQRNEIRIEISDETLAEMGSLTIAGENHFRSVFLGVLNSPVVHYCPEEAPELTLQRLWHRHCTRQSELRLDWEQRLTNTVHELLERRFAGALYEPLWCSRLTSILASDLLEQVMHIVGDEFKVVGLLSVGSVTELSTMSMATRSTQCDGIDTCKVFHYQNESVYAVFTCHLFQRFDRQLDDAPLDEDEVSDCPPASNEDSDQDDGDSSIYDRQLLDKDWEV